ncbi:CCA tRNA nucleotidyltransferase, mitochondrial [Lecanosticta acicola]|uniref:CCA tRNA nucleotidyltransferase, mitochondrial n=1 Tax=Lecanosticta acicola TaxID=111012 RepID=A0AAI8YU38_9PEZI|nr:CCA tRNA nucleotidyltransferase, mitochondrial [Lecanosticta acicola]
MSPARLVTSPERSKRRRLNTPSPVRVRSYSSMSRLLVQEVEDEAAPPTELHLTEVETTFKNLLLDVAKYIDETPAAVHVEGQVALPEDLAKQPLVLRWTGGWVRDKLLGVQSHDIDVAINKMTGYQFGLRMKEYLEISGNLEKYGLDSVARDDGQSQKAGATDKSKTVGGLHKIEANPEKSKHLETTTVRILGLDVDFVNLRKETYSDDSRNPQMEFGTPEEDALRRDATVNAMFYNINTGEIEDYTKRGHEDMRMKVIRTPLEPYQTFKDDPLRVLRLIRFASRLGYTIVPEALDAMGNADIKDALRRKISRERVGVELDKALQGPDPHEAMRLIFSLNLYETIFSDPAVIAVDHYTPDEEGWQTIIDALNEIINNGDVLQQHLARDKDEQYLAWMLAAVVPYRDAPQPEPSEPGRKPPPPISVTVAREGVKATNKTSDVILAAVRHQEEISNLVDQLYQKQRRPDKKWESEDPAARDVLGMAVRRWGSSWRSQVLYSMLVDTANSPDQLETIQRKYTTFLDQLQALDLLEVCTLKPLLDGKALAKAIGTPPGPWMKDALDVVMAWQLRNPDAKDPQQAIEEVKAHQSNTSNGNGELASDLIRHFLKLTIRPLFIKAKPDNVTGQGRKAATASLPKKLGMQTEDESITKPWKSTKDAFSLDLLRWVVRRLDAKLAAQFWPLIVPPILTLIDDWEAKYKTVGAEFLHGLLKATPHELLRRTGLGEVFEEALMPCLSCLPTLTPEPESLALLNQAYPTLLTLTNLRHPPPPTSNPQRIKALDSILRRGPLQSYSLLPPHVPSIRATLLAHLTTLLDLLDLNSVKHIIDVLPLIADVLGRPYNPDNREMLFRAADALQALMRNCWPRIARWRGEICNGICLQWTAAAAASSEEGVEDWREKLRETVKLLEVVVEAQQEEDVDWRAESEMLVEADERLVGLFGAGKKESE